MEEFVAAMSNSTHAIYLNGVGWVWLVAASGVGGVFGEFAAERIGTYKIGDGWSTLLGACGLGPIVEAVLDPGLRPRIRVDPLFPKLRPTPNVNYL